MNNQPPNPRDRGPDDERLEDGEIDLTGSVSQPEALFDVIHDAIAEADGVGDKIPAWGARVIARQLANQRPEIVGELHHYAVTGTVNHPALAQELAVYAKSIDPDSRELADLLGLYLIKQPAGRRLRSGDTPAPESIVERGLREYGPPFWAFLQLSDSTEEPGTVLERFKRFHLGSYSSIREILDNLTEFPNFRQAIEEAEEEWGFQRFLTVDYPKLEATVHASWEVVTFNKELHVFAR